MDYQLSIQEEINHLNQQPSKWPNKPIHGVSEGISLSHYFISLCKWYTLTYWCTGKPSVICWWHCHLNTSTKYFILFYFINLRLQKYRNQILTWYDKWRIKLNPGKNYLINFFRRRFLMMHQSLCMDNH